MTTAHDYRGSSLGPYRFLCARGASRWCSTTTVQYLHGTMDTPDSTSDAAMRAGMEGLVVAMKDRTPEPERTEPGIVGEEQAGVVTDGVLAAAPWRAAAPTSSGSKGREPPPELS